MKKLFFLALSLLAFVGLFDMAHAMNIQRLLTLKKKHTSTVIINSLEESKKEKFIKKPEKLTEMINFTMESEKEKQKFTERLKEISINDIEKMIPEKKRYHLVCASRLGLTDFFQKFLEQVTINDKDARVIFLGALHSPTIDLIKMLLSNEKFMQKILYEDDMDMACRNLNKRKEQTEGPEYCSINIMLKKLMLSKKTVDN